MKLPELYEHRMKMLLKEEYEDFVACFDNSYSGGIRINTLKISAKEFEKLSSLRLERIPFIKNGYYYHDKDKPSKHPHYYAGLYYMQEPSAMTPASLMPVQPGDKVLDLCAAPGGKSTELAAKLCGKGLLVANDISNSRAKALLKNIELFGIKNAVVISETPAKLVKEFPEYFDKILVDAPCSGEGMFRKSPAIMKNWEQYGVDYYNRLQKEILPHAVNMLKPGGYLLYSTCTFSPEEDEGTVNWLLNKYDNLSVVQALTDDKDVDYGGFSFGKPDWLNNLTEENKIYDDMLKNCIRLWPHKISGEGHFIALIKKSAEANAECCIDTTTDMYGVNVPSTPLIYTLPKAQQMGARFKKNNEIINGNKCIAEESREFLSRLRMTIDYNNIMVRDDRLYLLPDGITTLKGLRILRSGLLLGEQKKGRFEPSQALACALKQDEYDNVYSLDSMDEDVIRYLKCESITLKTEVNQGWVLVCTDGFPLGWGKAGSGQIFKNKYLPGWRIM